MSAGFSIRSAGFWLEAIAPYGDVTTTWRQSREGGGLDVVEWQMDLPYDFDHPALRRGARVELMDGAQRVGQAELGEPGRTETGKQFSAAGIYRSAERFLCFDGSGQTTTTVDTAVTYATAAGCPLRRVGSLLADPLVTGDTTDSLNYLSQLLTDFAVEKSVWWSADADGVIQADATPTVPMWHLVPNVADPGTADDEYASILFGRYRSGTTLVTTSANDAASASRWGVAQRAVDLTGFGSMSAGRATNRLAGILAQGRTRLTFTDRLEVDNTQLLTRGGRPAPLSLVRHGQLVRAHGLQSYSQWLNGKPWLDFMIGEAVWANGADTITIAPVGLAARTFEDLLAESAASSLKP